MRRVGVLLVILAVALALRLGWVLTRPAQLHYPDSIGYSMIADNILDGRGVVQSDFTQIARVPTYPLFLSACYRVFGRDNYRAARVVQAVLGTLLCLVVYALAAHIFNRRVGWVAAAICAVYPFFVYYSGLLLTETLFALALTVFMLLVITIEQGEWESTFTAGAVAGVLAGVTVLLKASFLMFLPFLGVVWLLVSRRPTRALAAIVVIVLCTGIIMCPWVVRNWTLTERFVPTTLTVGISLWEGVHPGADGGPAMDRLPARVYGLSEYDENQAYLKMARQAIGKDPGRILALAGKKFIRFWNIIPNSPDHQKLIYRVISIFSVVPLLCFAVVGLVGAPTPRGERLLLVCPAIYFTLLHMLFVSSRRYI